MPNIVNKSITREYENRLSGDVDLLLVQPLGLTVQEVNVFRGMLEEAQLSLRVVKGSLVRRVLEAQGLTGVEPLFEGPSALILGQDDVEVEGAAIAAARVIEAWRKQSGSELPAVKGGIMEGEVLDAARAAALAKLPTKAEVQSKLLGQILSPGATLSGQFVASGSRVAGAIKAHAEKLESGD